MKIKHRNILKRLMSVTNSLGGALDGTSTNEAKYRDRQRAHMNTYKIIYAVLTDNPENEGAKDSWQDAEQAILKLEELVKKEYPDRKGNY